MSLRIKAVRVSVACSKSRSGRGNGDTPYGKPGQPLGAMTQIEDMGDVESPRGRAQQELVRRPVRRCIADRGHHVGIAYAGDREAQPRRRRQTLDALELGARAGQAGGRIAHPVEAMQPPRHDQAERRRLLLVVSLAGRHDRLRVGAPVRDNQHACLGRLNAE